MPFTIFLCLCTVNDSDLQEAGKIFYSKIHEALEPLNFQWLLFYTKKRQDIF